MIFIRPLGENLHQSDDTLLRMIIIHIFPSKYKDFHKYAQNVYTDTNITISHVLKKGKQTAHRKLSTREIYLSFLEISPGKSDNKAKRLLSGHSIYLFAPFVLSEISISYAKSLLNIKRQVQYILKWIVPVS